MSTTHFDPIPGRAPDHVLVEADQKARRHIRVVKTCLWIAPFAITTFVTSGVWTLLSAQGAESFSDVTLPAGALLLSYIVMAVPVSICLGAWLHVVLPQITLKDKDTPGWHTGPLGVIWHTDEAGDQSVVRDPLS